MWFTSTNTSIRMTSVNGSNVHEAFALMATLLAPRVPLRYLELSGRLLQRRQMEEVFEERTAAKRCAFPACENSLPKLTGKFRVSLTRQEIYDARYERQFCSQTCLKKARVLLSKLAHKPPQLAPSLVDVFGTDKPNPLDYEDDTKPVKAADNFAMQKPTPMPKVRSLWAKTQDLGVVERRHSTANAMTGGIAPCIQATASLALKENEAPAPPDTNFPTMEHAMLIEGYVFPAHKQKLAKKVEKIVKKSQDEGDDGDDIVVSDSDESDLAASDVSSAGSFEISDFDDKEVVGLNDLPLFSHLWGLLSSWITHETTLQVAGQPLPANREEKDHQDSLVGRPDNAEARRARQIRVERWNSLSLMLHRPLPQVALKLKLASDRFANHRIDTITETFSLRDAIDTRNVHQWTCIATILMLVAYNIKPDELSGERSDQVKALTKLDSSELRQLLQLFYEVRNDGDIAVDMDVAPVPEDMLSIKNAANGQTSDDKPPAFCRKCRRAKSKCICQTRIKAPKDEELTTAQLEGMLQEALVIRDENDELLQPDD